MKDLATRKADGQTGAILGVHLVGPRASAGLGLGNMAVNLDPPPDQVAKFIQPHPTLSESLGEAMLAVTGRGLHLA